MSLTSITPILIVYLQKNNESVTQVLDAGKIPPETTAKTALASPLSDNSISQNGENVNSFSSGAGVGSADDASGEVFRTPEVKEIYTKNQGLFDDGLNPHQRYIQNISDKFGIRLLWDKTGKVKTGKYNSQTKTIILNPDMGTAEAYIFVFKHEFTHWLANRKGFQNIKNYLLNKSSQFYEFALEKCKEYGIKHGDNREDVILIVVETRRVSVCVLHIRFA